MGSSSARATLNRVRRASRAKCGTPSEMLKDGAGMGCLRPAGPHPMGETLPGVLWVKEREEGGGPA